MAKESVMTLQSDWSGGKSPYGVSWGKFMMWIFLLSDAFTFGGLLCGYSALRYKNAAWPHASEVFTAFPFTHAKIPLLFVGLMTFILICSSLTMVLAVHSGYHNDKKKTVRYLLWTIVGGLLFLGCQAFEWGHLMGEGYGLTTNPHGIVQFSTLFFLITGFHGSHVASGVVLLLITIGRVGSGALERKGSYEFVEKIGLYWHFVDLVWVFVFTFFYLV